MFTTGQWVFTLFFIIVFVLAMIAGYRKDKKTHRKHYKGSKWILLGFAIFIIILFIIKNFVKK